MKKLLNKLKSLIKKSKRQVAVINLYGMISGGRSGLGKSNLSLSSIISYIDKAFSIKGVKAIALAVNSPGGSPVQTELIYNYIRSKADKKKIPIYSFVEDIAASGGYWLACAGDEIYASRSSIVGSIGVISAGFGFVEAMNKLGVERRVYTQGKNKSVLDPFQPQKKSDVDLLLGVQKDVHDNFKSLVRTARKDKLAADDDELFTGKFWSGAQALELGLIDGHGDLYTVIREKFGENCEVIKVVENESWLKKKLGISFFATDLVDTVINKIEEKVINNKFGL